MEITIVREEGRKEINDDEDSPSSIDTNQYTRRRAMNREQQFYDILESVFIGIPIEGKSGYVNLLRIKSKYYRQYMKPNLQSFIDQSLKEYPEFREELFRKLYTFFSRYFSEAGVLGLYSTPYHDSLYERVYNGEQQDKFVFSPENKSSYERLFEDKDVSLFWKTNRMYYVKTDHLFRSMSVEMDGIRFDFDASQIQYKKSNEKVSLVYRIVAMGRSNQGSADSKSPHPVPYVAIEVQYETSKNGKQVEHSTLSLGNDNIDNNQEQSVQENAKSTKKNSKAAQEEELSKIPSRWVGDAGALYERINFNKSRLVVKSVSPDTVEKALRAFLRQAEVDYFICKDARQFLREQFDLWIYQYIFSNMGEDVQTQFDQSRLDQLRILKQVAYRVIDMIAKFEDEMVKIWNKPKFVLDSHYVITLDRIWDKDHSVVEELIHHPNMPEQVGEWRQLGMVGDDFSPSAIIKENLMGNELHPKYQFLPLDTKYFPDMELRIIGLFDNLDEEMDGWLIRSENYQALNNLLRRFGGSISCVYADPPYNTDKECFPYVDGYKKSTWLSIMSDRLELMKHILTDSGVIYISCDDNEQETLKMLVSDVFGRENLIAVIPVVTNMGGSQDQMGFAHIHEYLTVVSKDKKQVRLEILPSDDDLDNWERDEIGPYKRGTSLRNRGENSTRERRPNLYFPLYITKDNRILTERESPEGVEVLPIGENGEELTWRWSKDKIAKESHNLIVERVGDRISIYKKDRPALGDLHGSKPKSILYRPEYSNATGTQDIKNLFGYKAYSYPKSPDFIKDLLIIAGNPPIVLDPFGGSGTTAHAILSLLREPNFSNKTKYILIEVDSNYFYPVTLCRIKKMIFSDTWSNGNVRTDGTGISHVIKYFELEQFEDVLREARYADNENPPPGDPIHYLFLADEKLLQAIDLDANSNRALLNLERLYNERRIDLAQTLSYLTGKPIKRISENSVTFTDGTEIIYDQIPGEYLRRLLWW